MSKSIYIFGNLDLPNDSLPLRILPELQKKFPDIQFVLKDPNEEWDAPEELTVLDTVQGIDRVVFFDDLSKFSTAPRLTMHDFDALAYMLYLKKLGKIKNARVIGVPPGANPDDIIGPVSEAVMKIFSR